MLRYEASPPGRPHGATGGAFSSGSGELATLSLCSGFPGGPPLLLLLNRPPVASAAPELESPGDRTLSGRGIAGAPTAGAQLSAKNRLMVPKSREQSAFGSLRVTRRAAKFATELRITLVDN